MCRICLHRRHILLNLKRKNMKLNLKKHLQLLTTVLMLAGTMPFVASCADDDMSKTVADYDPRYKGQVAFGNSDYNLEADAQEIDIPFSCDQSWTASLKSGDEAPSWASVSPESGEAGDKLSVKVKLDANEDLKNSRQVTLTITTEKGNTKTITIAQNYKVVVLNTAEIKDFDKYLCPESTNPHFEKGADFMLRQDSYYSWHRMKQSEHFFVFWSPEFGDDPNAESVDAKMRVDIDDLLAKAEHFYDTNVKTLGMAKVGQGKSMLDNYKMQIYLIYQDEWLATGSGYDDKIGALWVNPSTCQPVGSTIGHEIGHSFQYQVYADKVNMEGAAKDLHHGFRYGFGPEGAGGCAFWEQCAQWQAQLDYPEEMFGYHLDVWKKNYHRHFNHEWMRYASYWLQHVWVEKHGIDAFGRIWRESQYPEDPLQAYERLFCNNNQNTLYSDMYYYASRMVYYDLKFANNDKKPVVVPDAVKGDYSTSLYKIADQKYQVGYASCPGTTGFNVIKLKNAPGKTVSVKVDALEPGSALPKGDKGEMLDGDGKVVGTTKTYNAQDNKTSDYRYGYVAIVGGKPVYSDMHKGANGTASYQVPAGTTELYFVIQAAPTTYSRHEWNDKEADDEQWPYTITVDGTDVDSYNEVIDVVIDPNAKPQNTDLIVSVHGDESSSYAYATYNLAYLSSASICYAFCLTPEEITDKLVKSSECKDGVPEGKIGMRLKQADGSYSYEDNCGGTYAGFWCDAKGNQQNWGENARTYTKFNSIHELEIGFMPGAIKAGETYPEVLELVYNCGGKEIIATIKFNFIVGGAAAARMHRR